MKPRYLLFTCQHCQIITGVRWDLLDPGNNVVRCPECGQSKVISKNEEGGRS